ncbi:MAG: hypothetical protein HY318_10405 [Armatimonadetes bacterium]|nr:hypothetical protein [Armatimonadota bacterium]
MPLRPMVNFLYLCAASAAVLCCLPVEGSITEGLLVYAPFEGSAEAAFIRGFPELTLKGPFAFSAGRNGQGLRVSSAEGQVGLAYPCGTNMRNREGSLAFWVCPAWEFRVEEPERVRKMFTCATGAGDGFMIYWTSKGGGIYFASGQQKPGSGWEWRWDPHVQVSWKPGEWHHLAATWLTTREGTRRRLYLDGEMGAEDLVPGVIHAGIHTEQDFYLGGTVKHPGYTPLTWADGVYDDLAIWSRPLAPEEIRDLASGRFQKTLMEARSPQGQSRALAHAKLTPDHANFIYSPTDTVHLRPAGEISGEGTYVLSVVDFWGRAKQVAQGSTTNWPPAPIRWKPTASGAFKARAELLDSSRKPLARCDLTSWVVLPDQGASPLNPLLGVCPSLDPGITALARRLGFGWVRLMDQAGFSWWSYTEPSKGEWKWYDDSLVSATRHGLKVMGALYGTPAWAANPPDSPLHLRCPPRDWSEFENYVFQLVSHYPDIPAWEIWNEPCWGGGWLGTPEEYAHLMRSAYTAAKRARPNCIVVGLGGVNLDSAEWLEKVLKHSGTDCFDVAAVHYSGADPLIREKVAILREIMRANGGEKPLWDTEDAAFGASFYEQHVPPFVTERRNSRDALLGDRYREADAGLFDVEGRTCREAAFSVPRLLARNLSAGIEKTFFYLMHTYPLPWHQRMPINQNLVDFQGVPVPFAVAIATSGRLLHGAQFIVEAHPAEAHLYLFRTTGGLVLAGWTDGDEFVLRFRSGRAARVDVMGNEEPPRLGTLRVTRETAFWRLQAGSLEQWIRQVRTAHHTR